MLTCALELAMLVIGLIAVVMGKFDWALEKPLRGPAVRIAGVVLMLPLPLAFLLGVVVGLIRDRHPQPVDESDPDLVLLFAELGITLGCAATAGAILFLFGRSSGRRRRRARRAARRQVHDVPLPAVLVEGDEGAGIQTEPRPPRPVVRPSRPAQPLEEFPEEPRTEFTPISSSAVRWLIGGTVGGVVLVVVLCAGVGVWASLLRYQAREGPTGTPPPMANVPRPPQFPPAPPQPPARVRGPAAPTPAPPAPPPAAAEDAWVVHPPFPVDPKLLEAGGTVYLGDLQEFDLQPGPWPLGKGRMGDPNGGLVIVGGRRSPHGLGLHPPNAPTPARVRYALGKRARVFKTAVGLNDSVPDHPGPVQFFAIGDGKELWHSAVVRQRGRTEDCAVDVAAVDVLELRTRAEGSHFGAHAVWVEPRLFRDRQAADQEVPLDLPRADPASR
jgi:hypothetical protein